MTALRCAEWKRGNREDMETGYADKIIDKVEEPLFFQRKAGIIKIDIF